MPCYKYATKISTESLGNLPHVRFHVTRPFKYSGVDHDVPIIIKTSSLKTVYTNKGYICLFVCMVTKAIHLQAVSELMSIACATCTDIYSYYGTNFFGASKKLQNLYNKNLKSNTDEIPHTLS